MTEVTYKASVDRLARARTNMGSRLQIGAWGAEDVALVIRWSYTPVGVIGSWSQYSALAVGPRAQNLKLRANARARFEYSL